VYEFIRRFEAAESYLEDINAGEYRTAYDRLDGEISFGEFVARIDASNGALANRLKEHGIALVSKTIERIKPMTFAGQDITVAVQSRVLGKRNGETIEGDLVYQISFRFNENSKINMVQSIGDGWGC
jgi:hypothetical protein